MDEIYQNGLAAYLDYYRNLTPDTVEKLRALVTPDIHFRDPFNDIVGIEKVLEVFHDMYRNCEEPKSEIISTMRQGREAFLKWRFSFVPKTKALNGGNKVSFIGITEIEISQTGLICSHLDYWDAAREFYELLPGIGFVLRSLRKRLAV